MASQSHRTTGLLLSGGLDSAILLDQLVRSGWHVVPFYVRTGCTWDSCELAAIDRFSARLDSSKISDLVTFDMPLADLYGDHWSMTGIGVPDDASPDEAVFLPGRNALLLLKPAIWCRLNDIHQLALATLANNPFHDAAPAFFSRFESLMAQALDDRITIARPFEHLSKNEVMQRGRHLPLELTFSCLAPTGGLHCGTCNKCAERRRAFDAIGLEDRTQYSSSPAVIRR